MDVITGGGGLADELDDEDKAYFEADQSEPAEKEETAEAEAAAEPVAEAEASAETAEDNDGEEIVEMGEGANKGRFIRHGAFHRQRELAKAERAARTAAEQRATELEANFARADERLRVMMEALNGQQQPAQQDGDKKVPDPEQEPFEYMRYLENEIRQLNEQTGSVQARVQEQDHYASVRSAFMDEARGYVSKQPDFLEAYQHLLGSRDRQLQRLGRVDPQERAKIISQEELQIVTECFRNRRSPSELIYQLAQDVGYRRAEPQAAPAAAQQQSAVQKVSSIKEGQKSAKSLGAAAGGGAGQPLNAESLAGMSEEEFDRVVSKMSRAQRKEYFGG